MVKGALVALGIYGVLLVILRRVAMLHPLLAYVLSLLGAYAPSYFDGSEYTGKRYWAWFARHPVWRWLFAYFPARIHYEVPLDTKKRYIFASHPHGVASLHHVMYMTNACGFHDDASPGHTRRDICADIVFRIPIFRDLNLWLGCVHASSKTAKRVLSENKSLVTIVGGMNEQVLARKGHHMIYVKKRKGFIKLALTYGAPIVPIYVFGENDAYDNAPCLPSLRLWVLNNLRLPIILPWGRFGALPHKVPFVACVGTPIHVKRSEGEVTQDEIDRVHTQYVSAMRALFDRNKAKHGYPNATLEVL